MTNIVGEAEGINPSAIGKRQFVRINKNFCNYPLARDPRVKLHWRRHTDSRRWYARLPGDERITLWFPADGAARYRRCPSAFDMNVLFLLLAETRKQDSGKIAFPSYSAILRALSVGIDAKHLRQVEATLAFWSTVEIKFRNWYFAGERTDSGAYRPGRNDVMWLPPPIKVFGRATNTGRVRVRISEGWQNPHKKFNERVPLPLPATAAAQNTVLCLLVSAVEPAREDRVTRPRRVPMFCSKIGLNHKTRNRVLANALDAAATWFERHGGKLDHVIKDGEIVFVIQKPEPKRSDWPRTKPEPAETQTTRPAEARSKRSRLRVHRTRKRGRSWARMVGLYPGVDLSGLSSGPSPREPRMIEAFDLFGNRCWIPDPSDGEEEEEE